MKKQILISVFILPFLLMSFVSKDKKKIKEPVFSIKTIDKSVAKITDSLYAGKFEVSNLLYRYFGKDIINENKKDLLKNIQIDSLNWRDKLEYNEPMVEYYFRHPAYQNYPVVNISYDAANLFCKWLTDKYNSNPKRKFKKVLFRLPTEKEWEKAATGSFDFSAYPWGPYLYQNGHFMCNFRRIGDECVKYDSLSKSYQIDFDCGHNGIGSLLDAADLTAPVSSYFPNSYGLYNVCGNVAEMVQEKGISCGGGWKSPGADVRTKSRGHYTKSATDLGFRYFMEIIEK